MNELFNIVFFILSSNSSVYFPLQSVLTDHIPDAQWPHMAATLDNLAL